MAREIIWAPSAVKFISESLLYISETSYLQAESVELAILTKIYDAALAPEKFNKDKYKSNNKGEYRSFETHSFRVAFKYSDNQLLVLRIRHVRQEPSDY
jgi:plasmid stabilization system protein ParE